jgi:hypothetical protein
MMKNILIPLAWVMEFDDVGWDDGRELRLKKEHLAPACLVITHLRIMSCWLKSARNQV